MGIERLILKYSALLSGPLLLLTLYVWPITNNARYSVCMMRRTTGIPCATCGMTRSLASLAKGQLAQSIEYHPFGILVAVIIFAGWVYVTWFAVRGKNVPRINPWILLTGLLLLAVLFIGYWLYASIFPLFTTG